MNAQRDPLFLLSQEQAAEVLGIDSRELKELLDDGEIGAIKIGSRYRIPRRSLEAWQERIAQREPVAQPSAIFKRRARTQDRTERGAA